MDQVVYVEEYSLKDLQETVKRYVETGYVPYGPVVPFEFGNPGTCGHSRGFAQTLIKAGYRFESVADALFK